MKCNRLQSADTPINRHNKIASSKRFQQNFRYLQNEYKNRKRALLLGCGIRR